MKEAIIHIGMHKTGTSSIQATLANYDDGHTAYCRAIGVNHSASVTAMFSSARHNYGNWKRQGLSEEEIDALGEDLKFKLKTFLKASQHERIIISGEGIRQLRNDEKHALVRFFETHGYKVTIYCLFRHPASLIPSFLQQRIKGGSANIGLNNPGYLSSLAGFEDVVDAADIHVGDFDAMLAEHGSIVTWMATELGLDQSLISERRVNESLSGAAARLLFRTNRLAMPTIGSPRHMRARQRLVEAINRKYPKSAFGGIDKDIALRAIKPEVFDELPAIAEKYSITYEVGKDVTPDANLVTDYFADVDDIDLAGLRELLAEQDIPDLKDYDVDQILTLLFVKFLYGNSLGDGDAPLLRDVAYKIEDGAELTLRHALALMELAQRAQPELAAVSRKIDEYRARLAKGD